MICMPDDISSYKLKRIPPNGDIRKDAIARLKAQSIDDKKDKDIQRCYVLGEKIWTIIQAKLDSYFLQYKPPQIQTTRKRKRKRKQKEDTGEPKRQIPKPPNSLCGSEVVASPQHGSVRAATPSQNPKDTASVLLGSLHQTPQNPSLIPVQHGIAMGTEVETTGRSDSQLASHSAGLIAAVSHINNNLGNFDQGMETVEYSISYSCSNNVESDGFPVPGI
ncbi:uncharacterized protein LY89DRAFT_744019 [Mollisia scopiformis]|uniref:Uncharacterized protein n=1 Tax=Mollisia scopiformis TaxID=149040 RepID=A0A132B3I4_MOLSC|nr:uncharacterized protein LY89DRAFT_744019 [Mollisia scopiformis]KUJ06227.1 hypothetical protein LY89DRAFT_744019 [Mollisia scopiformis]